MVWQNFLILKVDQSILKVDQSTYAKLTCKIKFFHFSTLTANYVDKAIFEETYYGISLPYKVETSENDSVCGPVV